MTLIRQRAAATSNANPKRDRNRNASRPPSDIVAPNFYFSPRFFLRPGVFSCLRACVNDVRRAAHPSVIYCRASLPAGSVVLSHRRRFVFVEIGLFLGCGVLLRFYYGKLSAAGPEDECWGMSLNRKYARRKCPSVF